MKIDLTEEEIEIILEWFNCYCNEGGISKKDKVLGKKLLDYILFG